MPCRNWRALPTCSPTRPATSPCRQHLRRRALLPGRLEGKSVPDAFRRACAGSQQNHIDDHSDWAPRAAFAYALDGHKKGTQSKTVVRGGYGFFYDRLSIGSLMGLERDNGGPNSQVVTVVNNPTCFASATTPTAGSIPTPASLAVDLALPGTNCTPSTTNPPQIEQSTPIITPLTSSNWGRAWNARLQKPRP